MLRQTTFDGFTVAAHGKVVAARDLVATTTADVGGEPFAEAA
ncbi:hypothetical protein [Sphingobium chungangianum]